MGKVSESERDCGAALRWLNETPTGHRTWTAAKTFGGSVARFHDALTESGRAALHEDK